MIKFNAVTMAAIVTVAAASASAQVPWQPIFDLQASGGTGMANPASADFDMESFDIVCDDADASNDTKITCDTNDEITFEVNGADALTISDTAFVLTGGNIQLDGTAAQTACAAGAARGELSMVDGGAGVADTVEICTKDSGDAYAYRNLIAAGGGYTNPGIADLDLNGWDLITDADGNSELSTGDDQLDIILGGGTDFTFSANSFLPLSGSTIDFNGAGTITMDADGDLIMSAATDDVLRIDNTGATVNSPTISLTGDIGGTELEGTVVMVQGADPYIRVQVDDDSVTPALTTSVDLYSEKVEITSGNDYSWVSSTRVDNNSTDGDFRIMKTDGTTDIVLRVTADEDVGIYAQDSDAGHLVLPADADAKPTCDATQVGKIWIGDGDADTAEICLQTAVTPTYAWVNLISSATSFTGDLNGNNLTDSSDSIVSFATGVPLQFNASSGGRIDSQTSGVFLFEASNGADLFQMDTDNTKIAMEVGGSTNLDSLEANSWAVTATVGANSKAEMSYNATATQAYFSVDQSGGYGFSGSAAGAACNPATACDIVLRWEEDGVMKVERGTGSAMVGGTIKLGDPGTTKPTCAAGKKGVIWYADNAALQPDTIEMCVMESDGTTDSYSYRSLADLYFSFKTGGDTANAQTTSLSAAAGWEHIASGTDVWSVGSANGFKWEGTSDEKMDTLTGSAGKYVITWAMSATSSSAAVITFAVDVEGTRSCHASRKFPVTDEGAMGGTCIVTIAVGDEISMVANTDTDTTFTATHGNIVARKL